MIPYIPVSSVLVLVFTLGAFYYWKKHDNINFLWLGIIGVIDIFVNLGKYFLDIDLVNISIELESIVLQLISYSRLALIILIGLILLKFIKERGEGRYK